MGTNRGDLPGLPMGEQPVVESRWAGPVVADTFSGRIHVEWDSTATVTPLGQLAFFIEYLKQGSLFDGWVADCPLHYTSPNAPAKRDVLGTVMLSVLAAARVAGDARSSSAQSIASRTVSVCRVEAGSRRSRLPHRDRRPLLLCAFAAHPRGCRGADYERHSRDFPSWRPRRQPRFLGCAQPAHDDPRTYAQRTPTPCRVDAGSPHV